MKYFSRKTEYRGEFFDSKQELTRYIELKAAEARGEVGQIHRQVRFLIIPQVYGWKEIRLKTKTKTVRYTKELPAYYTADFVYREGRSIVIEDVKSPYTARLKDYVLRRKLMVAKITRHNIRAAWRLDERQPFVFREAEVRKNKTITKDY